MVVAQEGDSPAPGLYDKQGNPVDEQGNLLVSTDTVQIDQEMARRIAERYAQSFDPKTKPLFRNVVLMAEHGIIEQKVTFDVGRAQPLVINVDALTGNIYGEGCMGGPNQKKVVRYYNPQEFLGGAPPIGASVLSAGERGGLVSEEIWVFGATLLLGLLLGISAVIFYRVYRKVRSSRRA